MILITFVLFLIGIFSLFAVGNYISISANRNIGSPPLDLPIKTVSFPDKNGNEVSGWLIDGVVNKGAVLLIHGVKADRRSMLDRARFLVGSGYSVLMIDLQAHGESRGDRITFGYLESLSAIAAINFSRNNWPKKKLAIIGTSLGGASAIFASVEVKADVYILEAVYSTLRDATENRLKLRLGNFGVFLSNFLLWQTHIQLGFYADELSPLDKISNIGAPLLLIAGEKDMRTTLENSQALYQKALSPKLLWIVPNAKHQDFYQFARADYKKKVLNFLGAYLDK